VVFAAVIPSGPRDATLTPGPIGERRGVPVAESTLRDVEAGSKCKLTPALPAVAQRETDFRRAAKLCPKSGF
jgi:hypothetical protein